MEEALIPQIGSHLTRNTPSVLIPILNHLLNTQRTRSDFSYALGTMLIPTARRLVARFHHRHPSPKSLPVQAVGQVIEFFQTRWSVLPLLPQFSLIGFQAIRLRLSG